MANRIDWAAIKERLHVLEAPPDERARASVLRARAAKLARAPSTDAASERVEVVVFRRSGTAYAVAMASLREIQLCERITWVPHVPASCLGVVNLRGQIVPVFDVPAVLGGSAGAAPPVRVLVVEADGRALAVGADQVEDVVALERTEIEAPLATFGSTRAELLRGLARGDVLILDAERLVLSDALVVEIQ